MRKVPMAGYCLVRHAQEVAHDPTGSILTAAWHVTLTIPVLLIVGLIAVAAALLGVRWQRIGTAILIAVAVAMLMLKVFGG
jgi:hypothetical protein